jgi:hypothetical protein
MRYPAGLFRRAQLVLAPPYGGNWPTPPETPCHQAPAQRSPRPRPPSRRGAPPVRDPLAGSHGAPGRGARAWMPHGTDPPYGIHRRAFQVGAEPRFAPPYGGASLKSQLEQHGPQCPREPPPPSRRSAAARRGGRGPRRVGEVARWRVAPSPASRNAARRYGNTAERVGPGHNLSIGLEKSVAQYPVGH